MLLTVRDSKFLARLVSEGPLRVSDARPVYGDAKWYFYKRLAVLAGAGLVEIAGPRKQRVVVITERGLAAIRDPNTTPITVTHAKAVNQVPKDRQILERLSVFGAMTGKQIGEFCGSTKYYYRCIRKLLKQGYIVRRGRYYEITVKGMRSVGHDSPRLRYEYQKSSKIVVADIVQALDRWEFVPGYEFKRRFDLNRSSPLAGVLSRYGFHYGLYVLPKRPSAITVGRLRGEAKEMFEKTKVDRIVVVCFDSRAEAALMAPAAKDKAEGKDSEKSDVRKLWVGIKEVIAVTSPAETSLLEGYCSPGFNELLLRQFPGAQPSKRPFADYVWRDGYLSVLVVNDLLRREALAGYLKHAAAREGRRVVVVCLESQLEKLRELFPRASFAVLADDFSCFVKEVEPSVRFGKVDKLVQERFSF